MIHVCLEHGLSSELEKCSNGDGKIQSAVVGD
jgi:hypothetical protein